MACTDTITFNTGKLYLIQAQNFYEFWIVRRNKQRLESSWNVMAHGDAREGKWRGNRRMLWVASTLHTTSENCVSALLPLMRTPLMPVVDWTDVPADLNGLVRFAERRNMVSTRVPSHFKRSLLPYDRMVFITEKGCVYLVFACTSD